MIQRTKKKKLSFRQQAYKQLKKCLDTCTLREIRIEFKHSKVFSSTGYTGIKHLVYVFEDKINLKSGEKLVTYCSESNIAEIELPCDWKPGEKAKHPGKFPKI